MRKVKYYDENYCIGLIKAAVSPNGKNDAVNKCALKDHILKRVEKLKNQYGVTRENLLSEICFNFLRKSVIRKIDNQKGSPATFILHYVFNELRNIERSYARGTFDKAHKNCDAMDKVALHFEDPDDDGKSIPELTDYQDSEGLLIAQETLAQLRDLLGEHELSVLLGQSLMEQYSEITGLSRRSFYRRLSHARPVVEELLGASIF
jgi:hypothetical protein